ncbi:MAG: DMT family transporter, partial [Clostridia bacterium]|nr:DMT family transporter [Clostridia bacterium]
MQQQTTKKLLGSPALFLAALIWGTSFVVMKDSVEVFDPPVLLGIRFTLGCLLLCLIFVKKLKNLNKSYFIKGGILGAMLFTAYYTQTLGLTDTTPGKNAFLTAAYCVMVPFMMWFFSKKRPDLYNISAAFLCIAGVGFVSLTEGFSISFGDTFTLIGAAFYAIHIVAIALMAKDLDPTLSTMIQFGTAAILSWIVAAFTSSLPETVSNEAIWKILYLAAFPTATAMLLQNVGLKYAEATS